MMSLSRRDIVLVMEEDIGEKVIIDEKDIDKKL